MKRKIEAPAPRQRGERKQLSSIDNAPICDKLFATCPPAYRRPLRDLYRRFGSDPIPLETVHFVFFGYRFPKRKIGMIIQGLVEMGVVEREPMKYIKIVGGETDES